MKFCKTYQEYMEKQEKKLPTVGFKNLKKMLKKCRHQNVRSDHQLRFLMDDDKASDSDDNNNSIVTRCPHQCPVCDGTFFPALIKEMSAVIGCFNERAQKLLDVHLARGLKKYLFVCKGKPPKDHISFLQQGQDLVTYAMINALAVRKILKKYDKVHQSKQGLAFKSQAQSMHIEILQSPWLCELMAFHINVREKKLKSRGAATLFEGCFLSFTADGKPSLTCDLFDSVKLDVDLTCPICLDTVFYPVALTCGHIFCDICACSAASVSIVDGLKEASPKEKCPLCRQKRVYDGAVHLEELNILLSRRCPEYWAERLQSERAERIKQAKEHWENQCRAIVGV